MQTAYFQIPVLSLGPHGGTRVLVDFANTAAGRGARVRFLRPRGAVAKAYDLQEGVGVQDIGPAFGPLGFRYLVFLFLCPFYLRQGTLVANFFPTVYSVWAAAFLWRRPYLYFVQDIETWGTGAVGFLLNAACRLTWHSRRMVATSGFIAKTLSQYGRPPWKQVRIGVSAAFWAEAPAGAAKNYDVVCFPRREPWKRLDRLEKIIASYRGRYGALRVLCVGQDAALLDACRAWGAESVQPADEAALIAALDSARVLLFTSEREGLGLPPLEGMARGLPCVAFENDGVKTYLTAGGFLMAAGDEDKAAAQIHALVTDPVLYATVAAAAREVAASFATVQAFQAFLDSLNKE